MVQEEIMVPWNFWGEDTTLNFDLNKYISSFLFAYPKCTNCLFSHQYKQRCRPMILKVICLPFVVSWGVILTVLPCYKHKYCHLMDLGGNWDRLYLQNYCNYFHRESKWRFRFKTLHWEGSKVLPEGTNHDWVLFPIIIPHCVYLQHESCRPMSVR